MQSVAPKLLTNIGAGGSTRQPIMTAYQQQALACAAALAHAPARPRELKNTIPDAPKILLDYVYDWFVRVERGVYALSDGGRAALVKWKAHIPDQTTISSAQLDRVLELAK